MENINWQPATWTLVTVPWEELLGDLPLARKLVEEIMEGFSWGDNTVSLLEPASLAEDLVNYVGVLVREGTLDLETTNQYYRLLSRLVICEDSGFLIDLDHWVIDSEE
jgi:hypothetical protein